MGSQTRERQNQIVFANAVNNPILGQASSVITNSRYILLRKKEKRVLKGQKRACTKIVKVKSLMVLTLFQNLELDGIN